MSNGGKESAEFLKHLQDEKLKTQATRSSYVRQKLAYATGLLALGSLKPGSDKLSLLLYLLVPLLSIVFDLYILGEDYSVKRIGSFLGAGSVDGLEKRWEEYVFENRDPFAPFAAPMLTTIFAIAAGFAAGFAARSQPDAPPARQWSWLLAVPVCAIAGTWWLYFFYKRKQVKANTKAQKKVAAYKAELEAHRLAQLQLSKREPNSDEK